MNIKSLYSCKKQKQSYFNKQLNFYNDGKYFYLKKKLFLLVPKFSSLQFYIKVNNIKRIDKNLFFFKKF